MLKSAASVTILFFAIFQAHADDFPGACKMNSDKFHTEEGGCLQFASGTVFNMSPSTPRSYAKANDYCEALEEGGFSDWHLPGLEALETAAADRGADEHLRIEADFSFWAETNSTSEDAWTANLHSGKLGQSARHDEIGARVVCTRKPADVDGDGVPDSSDLCNLTPKLDGEMTAVFTSGIRKGCTSDDRLIGAFMAQRLQGMGCKEETGSFKNGTAGCVQIDENKEWSSTSPTQAPLKDTKKYCDQLVEGLESEQRDWRLPTAAELESASGPNMAVRHFKFDTSLAFVSSDIESRPVEAVAIQFPTFDDLPQVFVRLSDGERSFLATQKHVVDFKDYDYRESLVPTNGDQLVNIVCVRDLNS